MIMVIMIVIMVFTIISPITLGVIFGFCGRKITNLKEAITNLAIVFSISLGADTINKHGHKISQV